MEVFLDDLGTITNRNDWRFTVAFGELAIFKAQNPEISLDFSFSRIFIENSQILDFNGDSFPGAIFPDIKFPPRCSEPRIYLDFKPPFVFTADPYWPTFTAYDQGGYKIIELSYSDLSNVENPHFERTNHFYQYFSVCPDRTFQYRG